MCPVYLLRKHVGIQREGEAFPRAGQGKDVLRIEAALGEVPSGMELIYDPKLVHDLDALKAAIADADALAQALYDGMEE